MSLLTFSQTDTGTDSLVCIPAKHAREIAQELTLYDLCQLERESLQKDTLDLRSIISQKDSIIEIKTNEVSLLDSSLVASSQLNANLTTQKEVLEDKVDKVTTQRNVVGGLSLVLTILLALL
jgi:hypothetical protein